MNVTKALVLALLAAFFHPGSALAASRWWDGGTTNINGTGSGVSLGGAGTWNTTTDNWDQGSGLPYCAWTNADNDSAIFAGTAGTVTLGAAITANAITFSASGYTIAGTGGNTLTLGGATPTITMTDAATISAVLAGTANLTKAGAAALTLSGANTFTGGWTINAGPAYAYNSYTGALIPSTAAALGSGTLTLGNAAINELYVNGTMVITNNMVLPGSLSGEIGFIGGGSGTTSTYGGVISGGNSSLILGFSGNTSNPTTVNELTNANNTFIVEEIDVERGVLGITCAGALGNANNLLYMDQGGSNGQFRFDGNNLNVVQPIQQVETFFYNVNGNNATLSGSITGGTSSYSFGVIGGTSTGGTSAGSLTIAGSNTGAANYSVATNTLLIAASTNALGTGTKTVSSGGTIAFSNVGAYAGAGGITLNGAGCQSGGVGVGALLNLAGNNTFNNAITLASASSIGVSAGSLTLGGAISGAFALTKVGSGTLTLNGINSYSGPTFVSAGTLSGSGSIPGAVVVSNGCALSAINNSAFTNGSLTLGAAGSDAVTLTCSGNGSAVAGYFVVTGANSLTNNGTVTINITGSLPATPGTNTLIAYSGAIKGSGSFVLGPLPNRAVGYLATNASLPALQLVVTSLDSDLWVGAPTNNWDLSGTNDWRLLSSGLPTGFLNTDRVVFDDSASNFTVNVAAAVSPGGVTFSNNAHGYTLTGSGNITGGAGLTLQGAGTVTLDATNSYTGPTTINAGKLVLGTPAAIPGASATVVNGTLDVAGLSPNLGSLSGSGKVDNVSAGGTPVLSVANSAPSTFSGVIQNSSGELGLTVSGSSTLILTGTNTYGGPTLISAGTLQVGAGGTSGSLPPGTITDNGTLAYNLSDNVTVANNITGSGQLEQNGSGTLILAGNLSCGPTLANAGTLELLNTFNTYMNQPLEIASGALADTSGLLNLEVDENSSTASLNVVGPGLLNLTMTDSSTSNPDIYFGPDHSGTAYWGAAIAAPVNLGSSQRFIYGKTGHNGVGEYSFDKTDAQFRGTISGAGGLTIIAQMTWTADTPYMEVPFILMASNSFSGSLEIQRGSVYLGNVYALTQTNTLFLNPAAGNNARFFLYGTNATVGSLSSATTGASIIANGNEKTSASLTLPAATLTVWQGTNGTFAGSLQDVQPEYDGSGTGTTGPLNLTKNGPATLTLAGSNSFTGTLSVNQGTLLVNGPATGGGVVNVGNGATLGGSGTINSAVTATNGATLAAGNAGGLGTLTVNSLTLGAVASDILTLDCFANPAGAAGNFNVSNSKGLTNNGTATINVLGTTPSTPGVYTLVAYAGGIQGNGTFVAGTLPSDCTGYITNNAAASAIQLVISSVSYPQIIWAGAPVNNWNLLGSNVWLTTNGAPASYQDGDVVMFNDFGSNFLVNLTTTVAPDAVLVSNSVHNYLLLGNGQISGYAGLIKQGGASLTLGVSNSYSGPTTISAGTLVLGASNAIPSGTGAGNVTVNGTLDVGGFSPALNNLSGSGVVDNVSTGGSPILTVSNSTASVFAGIIQNTSGTLGLITLGSGTLTLSGNNTYGGMTVINGGTLQAGNGGAAGALGTGPILDNGTLILDRSDTNIFPNSIAGSGGLQQNGTGSVTVPGNLTYTGPTVVNAGALLFPKDVTFDAGTGTTLTVASNAVAETGFQLFLNANASSVAADISGTGLVRLVGNVNYVEAWADLVAGENNNGISTANYGISIAAGLDLGSTNRMFWGISSRDDVATYGLKGCDCQFNGPIYGTTAKLQLLGQNSWPGVNVMEEQFAFNASNSWTGPLEITRGSVYVGNSNAFNGNVLILDPAPSVNSRFFLYGFNTSVADLQSGGFGATVIANGNNVSSTNVGPATLTVNENLPTTFAGSIVDWYTEYTAPVTGPLSPTLSLVKNGSAALTLTGTNTYSGTTVINAGQLNFYGSSTGGGAVTVNPNATLGGSGPLSSAVTVKNGGVIDTGIAGYGNFQVRSLALGAGSGDVATLNLTPAAILNVTNNNGLVLNGGVASVTINLGGDITAVGTVPLITYAGTLGGSGFGAFQLGSVPPGILGYLTNDTVHASIDFVATQVTIPLWSGALSSVWTTNVLASPKNWVLSSDGVTPIDYVDGENVRFDDTSTNPTVTISVANVSPGSVTISNNVQSYVIGGSFGIVGPAGLAKQGNGRVTLATTNNYAGNTTISAGTLALGAAIAIPGGTGAGNVIVNGTLDEAGFSPTLNNLSGAGVVDDVSAGGSPVVTVNETTSTLFSGVIQNTTGSLGLTLAGTGTLSLNGTNTYSGPTLVGGGTLLVNGKLGASTVTVQSGGTLGGSGSIHNPATLNGGAAMDLTANAPLTLGALMLNGTVTVTAVGGISTTNSATYILLNYTAINATNLFQLAAVPGILNSGYAATLNATTNQLQLVIAPAKPTGTIADVRHIVIFTQENRSFDHYFGSLHGVHGYSDHVTETLKNGNSVLYQPSGSSYELPFHTTVMSIADLAHDWTTAHEELDNGWHDQWVAAKGTETMAYYERSDMPYHYALADAFTVCDEFHCCALTSTDPNRLYVFTGMIDPNGTAGYPNAGPVIDNTEPASGWGTNWPTYAQSLQKAGVSWKVYQASDNYDDNALAWFYAFKNAATTSPLYLNGLTDVSSISNGFAADVSNNVLPSVSWVVGPDYGSEHPSYEPGVGANYLQLMLNALAANPAVYNNTVFIYNIDEGDGFFDHEIPILPPAGTTNEYVSGAPIGLGERVPCIIISPWSRGGYVCSQVFDHTSVIRFIEQWTGVKDPNLSAWRRQVCGDLTSAFNFANPNTNFPIATLNAAAETVNYSSAGTTASPPSPQVVPVQESGTLIARPLPYQPNALAALDCGAGNCNIVMTNSGTVSYHFTIYPNAYSTILPTPYDVLPTNSATASFSTLTTGGNYDFSCYGPNGFLRRFAGNLTADCGQIDSLSYLNPITDGCKITLANPGASSVVFSVTNGWYANSLTTYTVPANSTNVVFVDASTNNGWYDLTVTASSDSLFVRRCAGHIETNANPAGIVSSENPSGFKDNVTFTATFAGYGTPTGTAQFQTNGVAMGAPIPLTNGLATIATALLPRTNNLVSVAYSGDALNSPVTNSLTQVVLNHPPVPAAVVYQRAASLPLNILISDLLTNVTDVDGDPITLVGVGTDGFNLLTTNGVTLSTNANYIIYTNSVTPRVNDSFEYTVSDGQGGVSLGTVMIVVNTNYVAPPTIPLIVSTTNAVVNFFGVPGAQYEVDRTTNLTPGVGLGWVPISTNIAPVSGIIQVNDSFQNLGLQTPPPGSYYRLRPNP